MYPHYFYIWEVNGFQYVKVFVIRNNQFRLTTDCAINKLIVIRVGFY